MMRSVALRNLLSLILLLVIALQVHAKNCDQVTDCQGCFDLKKGCKWSKSTFTCGTGNVKDPVKTSDGCSQMAQMQQLFPAIPGKFPAGVIPADTLKEWTRIQNHVINGEADKTTGRHWSANWIKDNPTSKLKQSDANTHLAEYTIPRSTVGKIKTVWDSTQYELIDVKNMCAMSIALNVKARSKEGAYVVQSPFGKTTCINYFAKNTGSCFPLGINSPSQGLGASCGSGSDDLIGESEAILVDQEILLSVNGTSSGSSMAPLTSEVITHVVPSSVIPHPNSPWTALKSAPKSPYLITSDPFGAATHIWSISDRGFKHVRSLDPPLPGGLIRVSLGLTSEPGVIVLAYDKPNQSAGVLRVYDIDRDGKMTHEVVTPSDLPSGSIDQVFKSTGEFVAVSLDGEDKIAILYKLEDRTLKEVFRVTIPDATGVESLLILHILADGSLLTGRTTGPSFNLDLSLHRLSASETEPIRCTLPPVNKECDYVDPSYVLPLSDSLIILAVKESSSEDDYHPYTTTSSVHFISLPSLTVTASIPFPHSVTRLVHSPSLGVVIALGARLGHGVDSDRVPIVTFLDANTGTQKHQVELPRSTAIVRCTTDKLVVVYKTGLVSHTPLQDVIAGQEISEAQAVTTRPEPYNARARKAGEAWTWVDHVFVAGEGVVLFESRGIDMHFVKF